MVTGKQLNWLMLFVAIITLVGTMKFGWNLFQITGVAPKVLKEEVIWQGQALPPMAIYPMKHVATYTCTPETIVGEEVELCLIDYDVSCCRGINDVTKDSMCYLEMTRPVDVEKYSKYGQCCPNNNPEQNCRRELRCYFRADLPVLRIGDKFAFQYCGAQFEVVGGSPMVWRCMSREPKMSLGETWDFIVGFSGQQETLISKKITYHYCGNQICEDDESCATCPNDCGTCPDEVCLQVITTACNPITKEIKEFPTSCIDPGWTTDLSQCQIVECMTDLDCEMGKICKDGKCVSPDIMPDNTVIFIVLGLLALLGVLLYFARKR